MSRFRRRGRWMALAVLLLGGGCEVGPVRPRNAPDPAVYVACEDPVGAAAWQRAQAALALGDDATALVDLRTCAERCPLLVRAHLAYQDAARRLGGDAERAMQAFYLADANEVPVVREYLRARLAETSYAQGGALRAILARDPSFAWAHLSSARVHRRQGRLLQAVDAFGAAIANGPDLHEARLERAQVLAELGREVEAAVDYRAYLRARPEDEVATRAFVSLLLYQLERTGEAVELLDRLEARAPGDPMLRMDRAAALWQSNEPQQAIEAYVAVLAADPGTARAALNIGYLYYEVVPRDAAGRRRFWPRARAAFRMFLAQARPSDGHEQFEFTLGVPYRLEVIAELLGPDPETEVSLADLAWPVGDGA
ncbi:MAG: tetratricopeptide repeat protein [Planctomycetes bacterium]|nr:tetratricopeptide repeat protein [Planctomycetota bacterium]